MDPLSDLLALLKPKSNISCGFDAGGDWSVGFSNPEERIKCYAIVRGQCWLVVDGVGPAVLLQQGDAFILPGGRDFHLCSDPSLSPTTASAVFPPRTAAGEICVNGGGDVYLVGSRFTLGGAQAALMLGALPPIIHLQGDGERAALRWLVERMILELREGRSGSDLMAQHLAHMMLVQALRLHLDSDLLGVSWFAALRDSSLRLALCAIHADPARRWTLADLGRAAGLSRSAFAQRFRDVAGETPMDYLGRWRMFLALDRLQSGQPAMIEIAESLGYASESSFSTAFKRVMGASPRQFTRQRRMG